MTSRARPQRPPRPKVNDLGWQRVLADPDIASALHTKGWFTISAAQLSALSGREPRLMAKHDFRGARPLPLAQRGLSVLPLDRKSYAVGRFDIYADFPDDEALGPVHVLGLPEGIDTLRHDVLTSEGLALAAAGASGMLTDFLRTDTLYPTVSGRMSTGTFDLTFPGSDGPGFTINRAQMEIDAGFENAEQLAIIEAKNHLTADFNIRQLYFPYRRFSAQLDKPVRPVYLVYSNGLFRLYLYRFPNPDSPENIELVRAARYALSPSSIDRSTLAQAIATTTEIPSDEFTVPFPQADSFDRVINLCELCYPGALTADDITSEYDFTARQATYYVQAAAYLGLLRWAEDTAHLTATGRRIIATQDRTARNVALLRQIAMLPVFRQALADVAKTGAVPEHEKIVGYMKAAEINLSDETLKRRARTVYKWARWVLALCTEEEATQLSLFN